MSDDASSGRSRRKTRRVRRRALRVPLDDVPRTSAVTPAPSVVEVEMEASVEIELDGLAPADSTIEEVEIDVAAADEPELVEVESESEAHAAAAYSTSDGVGQAAVTVARAVMISAPPPAREETAPEPEVSAAVAVPVEDPAPPSEASARPVEDPGIDGPEVTHELELDGGDIEPADEPELGAETPSEEGAELASAKDTSAPIMESVDDGGSELLTVDDPEVTIDGNPDPDFDDGLEEVGELPGARTVPGASLAELEAARREALGEGEVADESSNGFDAEDGPDAEGPKSDQDAAIDDADLSPESADAAQPPDGADALELSEEEDDDDEVEDLDSGEIEVEPTPPAIEAPPPPPTALPEVPVRRRAWFEDFFNDDYLRTVRSPTDPQVARQCDFIIETLGLAPGGTILDVGCGLGLHAIELTNRGYLVVGLDLSLPMLSRASDEAQDRGLKINFLHGDMREMTFEGAFDAVLSWGTSFGYFDDDSNRQVANRMRHALKPGGKLLLDVTNRDYVLATQPNLVWFEGDGCVVMEETSINYFSSRLQVKRTVILDDGRQRDARYSIRLYALHELGQLLHQEGFRVEQVSGLEATRGVFFGAASPRLLVLAERRAITPVKGQAPAVPRPDAPSSSELEAVSPGSKSAPTTPPPASNTLPPQNGDPGDPTSA